SAIHDIATTSNCSVQHVRHEQGCSAAAIGHRHIPRAVDPVSGECLDHGAIAVENEQPSTLGGSRGSIGGWQAAHDDPSGLEDDQRGGQADSAWAAARQRRGTDLGKLADGSARRNLHNRGASSLQVCAVVEIADEKVSCRERSNSCRYDKKPVWIHIAIAWNCGSDG